MTRVETQEVEETGTQEQSNQNRKTGRRRKRSSQGMRVAHVYELSVVPATKIYGCGGRG
jgi:hypothetical protein